MTKLLITSERVVKAAAACAHAVLVQAQPTNEAGLLEATRKVLDRALETAQEEAVELGTRDVPDDQARVWREAAVEKLRELGAEAEDVDADVHCEVRRVTSDSPNCWVQVWVYVEAGEVQGDTSAVEAIRQDAPLALPPELGPAFDWKLGILSRADDNQRETKRDLNLLRRAVRELYARLGAR